MKQVKLKFGIVISFILLFGCLPSLHPLYTKDTIVFDETLLGKWYDEDDGSWTFTKNDNKNYNLRVFSEDGKECFFEVHLVQLEDYRFIDLYPGYITAPENIPDIYSYSWFPVHTFMKLDFSDPNLQLQWINFFDLIEWSPETLRHERIHGKGSSIVITAKPEEIQRVLIKNLDEVIYDEESVMLQKCPVNFSEVNAFYDKAFLGIWKSSDNQCLNITPANNGYDILYNDDQTKQTFRGILYNLNNQSALGLYYYTSNNSEIFHRNMTLPPDILIQIECDKQQLKIRHIKWDEAEIFIANSSKYSFENLEPDNVFQRTAED